MEISGKALLGACGKTVREDREKEVEEVEEVKEVKERRRRSGALSYELSWLRG
jgi:hypothetical protein